MPKKKLHERGPSLGSDKSDGNPHHPPKVKDFEVKYNPIFESPDAAVRDPRNAKVRVKVGDKRIRDLVEWDQSRSRK